MMWPMVISRMFSILSFLSHLVFFSSCVYFKNPISPNKAIRLTWNSSWVNEIIFEFDEIKKNDLIQMEIASAINS